MRVATPPNPEDLVDLISTTLSEIGTELGGSLVGVGVGTPDPSMHPGA